MKINSDINILGGLPDWGLIESLVNYGHKINMVEDGIQKYATIKTDKSFKKYELAVKNTLIKPFNDNIKALIISVISNEGISVDSKILLFWNASFNNELFNHFNEQVFFPAFYGGRISIKNEEVIACLDELKIEEPKLETWSKSLIENISSKYLTLLKKFGLMEGIQKKVIIHPILNDKMFILFIYWIVSIEEKTNILNSPWLQFSFFEKSYFIDRILQKKYARYFNLHYTGDILRIEPLFNYKSIYHEVISS